MCSLTLQPPCPGGCVSALRVVGRCAIGGDTAALLLISKLKDTIPLSVTITYPVTASARAVTSGSLAITRK
jgi:hypothetical protein